MSKTGCWPAKMDRRSWIGDKHSVSAIVFSISSVRFSFNPFFVVSSPFESIQHVRVVIVVCQRAELVASLVFAESSWKKGTAKVRNPGGHPAHYTSVQGCGCWFQGFSGPVYLNNIWICYDMLCISTHAMLSPPTVRNFIVDMMLSSSATCSSSAIFLPATALQNESCWESFVSTLQAKSTKFQIRRWLSRGRLQQ